MSKLIDELESKVTYTMENKYRATFDRRAQYKGNGIYTIGRLYSTDPRELFLMFVADQEDVDYEGKKWEEENEVE